MVTLTVGVVSVVTAGAVTSPSEGAAASLLLVVDTESAEGMIGIFIISWLGQFIGHKIEGKKPSFFKDLQFLLIGPAWLLSFIFTKIGLKY